jgi:Mce-associated membrane protein
MAEHDGAAEKAEPIDTSALLDEESIADELDAGEVAPDDADDVVDIDAEEVDAGEAEDIADQGNEKPARQWFSGTRGLITVGLAIIVALIGLAGWLGYRVHQDREEQAQRNLFVQVARQTAINLTTINYTEVDADIKRVLDSATGPFHDDFQNRSQPFVDVVKKVQSKSEGSISEAALLSATKDQAQVLLAVSVKTSIAAQPDQEPRRWRMRITVDKAGDSAKASNVEFVP